jgi:AraC family transcriptional regulator
MSRGGGSVMEYPERMQRAIDYIEAHLKDSLPVDQVAKQAFLSVSHLYRIFPIMTGCTVGQYIRKRRLSCSADEILHTHKRVIDVAFDYQFESQESYIRAFKSMFGITPGEYRKAPGIIAVYNRLYLDSSHSREPLPKQPDIIKKKFTLVGVEAKVDLRADFSDALDALRRTLRQNLAAVKNKAVPERMIGVWLPDHGDANDELSPKRVYYTGVEVTRAEDVPAHLIVRDMPESLFARFRERSRGTMSRYAYTEWLPKSGYILNMDNLPGDLEIFDDMEHDAVDDGCDILLPIQTA